MPKTMLAVALIAAAEVARKQGLDTEVVHIKMRPELPEACMIEPVKPPRMHDGDTWRRTGKRKGRRAS